MNQKEILTHHRFLTALSRKYPNQYVAMAGKQVLAIGKDQFAVLKKAEKKLLTKNSTVGLYYLPGKNRPFYLLKTTRVHPL